MKNFIILLTVLSFWSCNQNQSKNDVVVSDRNNRWYIEVIEGHEFLYKNSSCVHRPSCKACKTIKETVNN